jgi:hypothetical protein
LPRNARNAAAPATSTMTMLLIPTIAGPLGTGDLETLAGGTNGG